MIHDPQWPAELDRVIAAPRHHFALFENDEVRVIETIVRAGDVTPVHTHPKTVMYVQSDSHFIREDDTGRVLDDTRDRGPSFVLSRVLWSDGTPPHFLESPSDDDVLVIGVEMKK